MILTGGRWKVRWKVRWAAKNSIAAGFIDIIDTYLTKIYELYTA